MEYRMLGKSDLKISRIGFGCMSLDSEDPNSRNILRKALDNGINYFDTADIYHQGQAEAMLGRAFRGIRNQVVLATKVGNRWRSDQSGLDWVPSKNYILSSVRDSLRRLNTDYIDLYQLHGGTIEDPIDDIIEAFEQLINEGSIRYYGISSIRPVVIREYVKRSSIISVMIQYSLLDRRPEEEVLSFLKENQVGVLARGVLAKGLLLTKPAEIYLDYSADQVETMSAAMTKITKGLHTSESISIQYVLNHPAVDSAIIGIRTEDHLKKAIDAYYSMNAADKIIEAVSRILPANHYEAHR
jgi:aryl-alcohol dehydrogenase-like predicted oxidoreductase